MTQTLRNYQAKIATVAILAATFMAAGTANAVDCTSASNDPICQGITGAQPTNTPTTLFGTNGIFSTIADTLILVVGAVSVIMLIIGGLRYVLSSGESSAVKGAKDTILYAIVGIVVSLLAFAAVSFVAGKFITG